MVTKRQDPYELYCRDRHQIQGWYSQAASICSQIFQVALDGRVSRRRLLDISEALEELSVRVGRSAGNAD
jgi:hypothetical protein